MIDTHIHMVPGVDDGAKDLDDAIKMVKMALTEGVDEMILTPHFNLPIYENLNVEKNFNLLNDYLKNEKIDFKIHLGNEIYLNEENLDSIKKGKVNTMGDSCYLLVEFPYFHFYPFHISMIEEIQRVGYEVILAHIERYQIFERKPDILKDFVRNGVYTQVTSKYIIDRKTRSRGLRLIKDGMVHIIASDGHDILDRPPIMKKAYKIIERALGVRCAETIFEKNPRSIILNEPLEIPFIKKQFRLI